MTAEQNRRILVVDDNEAIHADFRKILASDAPASKSFEEACAALLGGGASVSVADTPYDLDSAFQGQQALEMVRQALKDGRPYSMAFIDVRMPPGWDGVETIKRIWAEYPDLEVVICTAYSDYSWEDILRELGRSDRLLILKKPFDNVEVRQLASALTAKWQSSRQARLKLEDFEAMVRERTHELHVARIAADDASRAKSEFLANVSHEIRTPMTAILGHVDLLIDPRRTTSEHLDSVQSIQRNGQHLLQLINDILDLSKIEAGKLEIESMSCSPVELLADVSALLRPRAIEKGLQFSARCDDRIPEKIRTDPTRLRQILVNLIGNAIKFTTQGRVAVACALDTAADAEKPRLRFEVGDTGVGMTAEQVQRLFRPFVQADASTTRIFGGTGLGLSISKRLAEALGGDITCDSEPQVGTTFKATVATGPLHGVRFSDAPQELSFAVAPGEPEPEGAPATAIRSLNGYRILLAEDGPDNQYLIRLHLQRAGAAVDVAENGRIAVEMGLSAAASGNPYEAILMDMQMPEVDGYAATKKLREAHYEGPIIALTANAMDGDREVCLNAGCDDYCSKPIDFRQLLKVVDKSIARPAPVPC